MLVESTVLRLGKHVHTTEYSRTTTCILWIHLVPQINVTTEVKIVSPKSKK